MDNGVKRKYVGFLVSGRGKAASQLAHHNKKLERYFLCRPHPGSLNLVLKESLSFCPKSAAFFGSDSEGFWQVSIAGLDCLVRRWKGCPLHILEIVSPINMRGYFDIDNGQAVEVEIESSHIANHGWISWLVWALIWKFREDWYYSSDRYRDFPKKTRISRYFYTKLACQVM